MKRTPPSVGAAIVCILLLATATSLIFSTVSAEDVSGLECYQFTWLKDQNFTDCDEQNDQGIPCYEPFIRTDPSYYPPNITDLEEHCKNMICPTFKCTGQQNQCLRWVIYDVKNKPLYMTLFCGTMVDITKSKDNPEADAKPINNKCYLTKNGTETIEGCSCNRYLCNTATGIPSIRLSTGAVSTLVVLLYMMWLR